MIIPANIIGREVEVEYGYFPYVPPTRYDPAEEELIEIIAAWEHGTKIALHIADERKIIDYIGKEIHKP